MSIVVQKYKGSSVADVARMKQVAERVMRTRRQGYDVVVVVSAMGDTTDDLLALAKQVSPNPDRRELDMLLTAGERISMALLSIAIRELGGDAISFTGSAPQRGCRAGDPAPAPRSAATLSGSPAPSSASPASETFSS